MKKIMLSLGVALVGMTAFKTSTHNNAAAAHETTTVVTATANNEDNTKPNINSSDATTLYNQIDFGGNKISFEAFDKAYQGYNNLKKAGKLNGNDIISIADFSQVSTAKRLWVIDLSQKKVLFNTQVAHGQGSGGEYATAFSNNGNSHQSSIGFFVTTDTYSGKHGNSLRIAGMDIGFNDKAEARSVVIHAANYCSASYLAQNNRIGRSWGCPAVSPELAQPIINTIKGGTMLFIYAPQAKYSSEWLNA